MNTSPQFHLTSRTQFVRFVCALIGAIFFAFGFYELFDIGSGSGSMITLPVSFTFAIEAHAYTGDSKFISRRRNVGFHSSAFLMILIGLGLMILTFPDTDWKNSTKLGIISCFASAHVLIFLAYFKQPYLSAEQGVDGG